MTATEKVTAMYAEAEAKAPRVNVRTLDGRRISVPQFDNPLNLWKRVRGEWVIDKTMRVVAKNP